MSTSRLDSRPSPETYWPWYNDLAVWSLRKIISSDWVVFEYGSGFSTLFYLQAGLSVRFVETNPAWHDLVLSKAGALGEFVDVRGFLVKSKREFVECFSQNCEGVRANVVAVDSIERAECLLNAPNLLDAGEGLIILDNSERRNLRSARSALRAWGYCELVMYSARRNVRACFVGGGYAPGNCESLVFSVSSFFAKKGSKMHKSLLEAGIVSNVVLP